METSEGRSFIGRFKKGEDLLAAITEMCRTNRVKKGVFSVIGAVSSAKMGYYRQKEREYIECVSLERILEIVSCTGNISLRKGDIFVHAHVTFADHEGSCYGGHLMPGAAVFAAEYYVKELKGADLVRQHDPATGLELWQEEGEIEARETKDEGRRTMDDV